MLKPQTKKSFTTYIMVTLAFVIMMILSSTGNVSSQIDGLLVPLCVYSILAVSLNLTVGILGELSLGQAGFMCVGAYASALFSIATKETILVEWVRFPLAILVGGIFAAIFGILIGIPVLRLNGDYLAIVTLAFGEIIKNVFAALYVGIDSKGLHIALNQADMNLEADGRQQLVRGLGLVAAISVIIGNVIGTGVFLKARVMTCNVGTPGWVIAAWIAAGLLSLAGALTYAELTAMARRSKAFNAVIDPDHKPFLTPGDMPHKIEQFCKDTKQRPPHTRRLV